MFDFVEITVHRKFRRAVEENDYEGLSKFEVGKLNTLLAEKGLSFSDPAYISPCAQAGPCDATGNHCDKAFRVRIGFKK